MNEHGDEFPVVIGQSGPLQGMRWPIRKEVLLIGRGDDCDIMVAERQVSRHHARVRKLADGFVVEDLGSKNGTHVNGQPVRGTARLEDGDVIQVALAAKLIFVGSEATMPLTMDEGTGIGRLRMDAQAHRIWVAEREIDPRCHRRNTACWNFCITSETAWYPGMRSSLRSGPGPTCRVSPSRRSMRW